MSWKRILERSRALEASERSIAASIFESLIYWFDRLCLSKVNSQEYTVGDRYRNLD